MLTNLLTSTATGVPTAAVISSTLPAAEIDPQVLTSVVILANFLLKLLIDYAVGALASRRALARAPQREMDDE